MKSFSQFLQEDFPMMEPSSRHAGNTFTTRIPDGPSTKLGRIGPYEVHHHHEIDQVSVQHKGKQVGVMDISNVGRGRISINMPEMHRKHSGKNALVRNLVPKVYSMIADKIAPIESGTTQTPGGRSIWKRLAKMKPVTLGTPTGFRAPTSVKVHTHSKHPNLFMNAGNFEDYADEHEALHGGEYAGYGDFKNAKEHLAVSGMHPKRLAAIKKKEHLPHPNEFKKKTIKLSDIKKYNPAVHDSFVYGHPFQEDGNEDIVLRLDGKKKKSRSLMKKFVQYISEDIELSDDLSKPSIKKKRPYIGMHEDQWREHATKEKRIIKPIGTIGKDYTVYSSTNNRGDHTDHDGSDSKDPQRRVGHYTHHFLTVHNKTKNVVASAFGHSNEGNWSSGATFVHPDHSSKKVGFSVPGEMYKHISKHHTIWSGHTNTVGAAKMWKGLINDPENKVQHVPPYLRAGKPKPAHGMPDNKIWATREDDTKIIKAAKKAGITTHPVTMQWGSPKWDPSLPDSEQPRSIVSGKLRMPRKKK